MQSAADPLLWFGWSVLVGVERYYRTQLPRTCAAARPQLAKANTAFQAHPLVNRLNQPEKSISFEPVQKAASLVGLMWPVNESHERQRPRPPPHGAGACSYPSTPRGPPNVASLRKQLNCCVARHDAMCQKASKSAYLHECYGRARNLVKHNRKNTQNHSHGSHWSPLEG